MVKGGSNLGRLARHRLGGDANNKTHHIPDNHTADIAKKGKIVQIKSKSRSHAVRLS